MTKFYEWSWEYRKQRQLTYIIVTFCKSKRRWRDLNPRTGCPAYRISSADPSATWVHLHDIFHYIGERGKGQSFFLIDVKRIV